VLVSLRAWTGDIDPYDVLKEVWVQISGIPPKWSNYKTFQHISLAWGTVTPYSQVSLAWSRSGILVKIFQRFPRRDSLR
jgi:hypothetical protein